MSSPTDSIPTPVTEFQSSIGMPPGGTDARAECKQWERVCGELIAQREQLRTELVRVQAERDAYFKAWWKLECSTYQSPYTKDELFSFLDQKPTVQEVIDELDHAREK
jgi:hypothetical protein